MCTFTFGNETVVDDARKNKPKINNRMKVIVIRVLQTNGNVIVQLAQDAVTKRILIVKEHIHEEGANIQSANTRNELAAFHNLADVTTGIRQTMSVQIMRDSTIFYQRYTAFTLEDFYNARNPALLEHFAMQLIQTLEDLHTTHKIAHRDIKASNIFINVASEVFLGDFDSCYCCTDDDDAKVNEWYTSNESGVGTVTHRNIDMLSEGKSYDMRHADKWALGITLVDILVPNKDVVRICSSQQGYLEHQRKIKHDLTVNVEASSVAMQLRRCTVTSLESLLALFAA
jgi:serine/threonine protein kinase